MFNYDKYKSDKERHAIFKKEVNKIIIILLIVY